MQAIWRRTGRFDNVINIVLLAFSSLLAAVVCFGFLRSQANFDFKGSFTGAIAGFIAAFIVLGQLLRQLNSSSAELEKFHALNSRQLQDLQDKNQELQQKLIRGAPHPEDFEIEVDERQKLVLARPANWQPGGGVLFEFQLPTEQLSEGDLFPARIIVSYEPVTNETRDSNAYYQRLTQAFETGLGTLSGPYRIEFTHIGGEPGGIECLRAVVQSYARIRIRPDPVRGTPKLQDDYVSKAEFHTYLYNAIADYVNSRIEADAPADLLANDQLAKELVSDVEIGLESGRLRDMTMAFAFLNGEIERRQPSMGSPAREASVESSTVEARQGVGQVKDSGEDQPPEAVEQIQVLPVGRILVVCHHGALGRIYVFEFADNAADFAGSSSIFDKIIRSVRFLT
jgi:hypothetical protein